jgi:antitoxin HigA-1
VTQEGVKGDAFLRRGRRGWRFFFWRDEPNHDFVRNEPKEGRAMPMYDPPHPGEHVRHDCLEPLGLTVTRAAEVLGVSRKALSELVNGRSGISPEMAIRLSKAFGGNPEVWLRMQLSYDLWQAQQRAGQIKVTRYEPV